MKEWFLPKTPDLLAGLRELSGHGTAAFAAFVEWSKGNNHDGNSRAAIEASQDDASESKRRLLKGLQEAFSTPLDPEDLYWLCERLEGVVRQIRDTVREAEVLDMPPDEPMAQMGARLDDAMRLVDDAITQIGSDSRAATTLAERAHTTARLEREYRSAMSALLEVEDVREVMGRRELYRRYVRIGEALGRVAERISYALLKER